MQQYSIAVNIGPCECFFLLSIVTFHYACRMFVKKCADLGSESAFKVLSSSPPQTRSQTQAGFMSGSETEKGRIAR